MKNEAILVTLLFQLIVIVLIARVAGIVGRRLGHPIVVGEILAGLFLGPSFLGRAFPGAFRVLFPEGPGSTNQIIYMMSQIGLVFLMFLIGIEFDFGNVKAHGKSAGLVSLTGIVVPFALGLAFGYWLHPQFPETNLTAFSLFIATAISITAIPILGRILIEFNLTRTDVGVLTITAAAIDDALGWICLAVVSAIVSSKVDPVATTQMVAEVALLAIVLIKLVRPLAIKAIDREFTKREGHLSLNGLAVLIVAILGSAAITNKIGISSLFGPFMLGAVLYDQLEFREKVFESMKHFITAFFLPIFFTFTGLHTDMGSLGSGIMWIALGLLLFISFFGKYVGCYFAAKLSGFKHRQAAAIGIMMNTRALMGLIAANIGREMGAVTPPVYCMLVLMCVLSTIVTAPVLRRLIRGTELEEPYRRSEYVSSRRDMGLGVRELDEVPVA